MPSSGFRVDYQACLVVSVQFLVALDVKLAHAVFLEFRDVIRQTTLSLVPATISTPSTADTSSGLI